MIKTCVSKKFRFVKQQKNMGVAKVSMTTRNDENLFQSDSYQPRRSTERDPLN